MPRTLTITISDAEFEALLAAGSETGRTPEEVVAAAVAERFDGWRRFREALIAGLHERGVLAEPLPRPTSIEDVDLPPYGTPEWQAFVDRVGDEMSEALEESGKAILDLVER